MEVEGGLKLMESMMDDGNLGFWEFGIGMAIGMEIRCSGSGGEACVWRVCGVCAFSLFSSVVIS